MIDKEREDRLMARLATIHDRVQWMANEETRSAWVRGPAARGLYLDEKEKLVNEAERILDELMGTGPEV